MTRPVITMNAATVTAANTIRRPSQFPIPADTASDPIIMVIQLAQRINRTAGPPQIARTQAGGHLAASVLAASRQFAGYPRHYGPQCQLGSFVEWQSSQPTTANPRTVRTTPATTPTSEPRKTATPTPATMNAMPNVSNYVNPTQQATAVDSVHRIIARICVGVLRGGIGD